MNDSETYLAYATKLRADHQRIDANMRAIEELWLDKTRMISGSSDIKIIAEKLDNLRRDLQHHFDEEEAGGCLEEAVTVNPCFGSAADRLFHEHADLLAQLDKIIAKSGCAEVGVQTLTVKKDEFRDFAARLHAHEEEENHILQRCFEEESN